MVNASFSRRWCLTLALLSCGCGDKTKRSSPLVRVVGSVTTDAGAPVAGAKVTLSGTDMAAVSDANGAYVVVAGGAGVGSSATLTVGHPDYATRYTLVTLTTLTTKLDLQLRAHGIVTAVALPKVGEPAAEVAVPGPQADDGGATLRLQAGDLATPGGLAAVGNAEVRMSYWGTGASFVDAPAPLLGTAAGGNQVFGLYSYGMVDVEVRQGNDVLQVADGRTLALDFNRPAGLEPNVLAGIAPTDPLAPRLWYADPNSGRWSEAGSLASGALAIDPNSGTMHAKLPHLSAWNVDAQYKTNMCLTGKVVDNCNDKSSGGKYSLWLLSRGGELVVYTVTTDASGTYSVNIDGATQYADGRQEYTTDLYAWVSGFEQPAETACNPTGIATYSALCTKRGWPATSCAGWEYSVGQPSSGQWYPLPSDAWAARCKLPLLHLPLCGYTQGTLSTTQGGRCQAWANGRIVGGPPMVENACGKVPDFVVPGCGANPNQGNPCDAAGAKKEGDACNQDVDCCPNASLECADGLCVPRTDAG